jgi:hypothetical protein
MERGLHALSDPGRAALALWKVHLPATAEEPAAAVAS